VAVGPGQRSTEANILIFSTLGKRT